MELVQLELYKIFKQISVWITLIIMLIMSYLSLDYPVDTDLERDVYAEWAGPLTEEKIQQAEANHSGLMEREAARIDDEQQIFSERESIELAVYEEILLSRQVEEAAARLDQLEEMDGRAAELEAEMLGELRISRLFYDTGPTGAVGFVEFGSPFVMGVMLLIGLSTIYSGEYTTGVDQFILSSRKGRRTLVRAKVGAALIYTLIIMVVWEAFSLIVNFLQHGNSGWSAPLQLFSLVASQTHYAESPYVLSLLEYHYIQLGVHFIGAASFALLIVLVSSVSRSPLITFFVCSVIFMLPVVLSTLLNDPARWLEFVLGLSFINVTRVMPLFAEFRTVDIFGFPVLYPVFAVLLLTGLALVFTKITSEVMKRKEITS